MMNYDAYYRSEHDEILEIGKYNIGIHRGSFLLEPGKTVYKPKVD